MARKKNKERKERDKEESDDAKKGNVHGDAKRSAVAIFLFALAIIFVLGFFESAGALGKYLDKMVSLLFGWGKWLSPLVLIVAGIILLFRKETLFYVTKLVGLAVAFLALLGFFHLFLDPEKLAKFAQNGEGGGYVGFGLAYLLLKVSEVTAGTVVLAALFLIGIIIAFNVSIAGFFRGMSAFWKREKTIKEEEVISSQPAADSGIEFVDSPEEEKKEAKSEGIKEEEKVEPQFSIKSIPWLSRDKKMEEPTSHKRSWQFPPLDLLEPESGKAYGGDVKRRAQIIEDTLKHFGIEVELGDIQVGPTVTQYSFRPAVGIKLSKITALSNNLSLALAAHPIRIEAPIPGKSLVGIEVPNKQPALVRLKDFLQSDAFKSRKSNLTIALGKDVSGSHIFSDLHRMPHLLIAGSTGSGKSLCINSILLSFLYQNSPDDLRLIMVDPKRVELSLYNDIPHLLSDVIVESKKVLGAFKWAIGEMEHRYHLLQDTGSKDILSYNQKIQSGQKIIYTDSETKEVREEKLEKLPYIIIVIDELADLMASHGKEVEGAIIRLAQMARAVGIHLVVSTQRPSVEVLTGLIKANITTRIAFKVATQVDSRTILDVGGADKLLGNGDMLYLSSQSAKLRRIQGVFVSEAEVKKVVNFIKSQKWEIKEEELESLPGRQAGEENSGLLENGKVDFSTVAASDLYEDNLYEEAKRVVIEAGKASSSLLQRRLRIGYARAARLIDVLEERGVVGSGEGAKPREVLAKKEGHDNPISLENEEEQNRWQM
ncbi:MAG: DNA translocase FtsK 4TM domain-containing protein [Candidatus Moranbacteria bacterium]|nr:DNA translocase FtsK 4TM domain-containing protein [Candidatus Moranbacteria bacterium]